LIFNKKEFRVIDTENFYFFKNIKGYSSQERKDEFVEISTFVGLQNDSGKKSSQLSGSMKRPVQ
jgi:ABC-type multidrug transport system ATPase subunit